MMSIYLRVLPGPLILLVGACSFDSTGLATMGPATTSFTSSTSSTSFTSSTSSTSNQETDALTDPSTDPSAPTTNPTGDPTGGATGDVTTDPTGDLTTDPTAPATTTTDSTGGAVCGDGSVEGGEACDDGAMNGPGMTCNANCQLNVCGDMDVGPGESCDDGNEVDGDGCSALCVSEDCGDKMVQNPEECDDGNQNDNDACTNACTLADCGDGILQDGVDECEDGNNDDTDACVACANAICGDGKVQAGVEDCDDGNDNDNDVCPDACKFVKRVFVSSVEYDGDLGDVAGADAKCATLANKANLPGTFLAWVSAQNPNTAPAMRFMKAMIPYVKANGEKVADDWTDLIDGSLDTPINVYEDGKNASGEQQVWTNVAANGTEDPDDIYDCGDWKDDGIFGSIGNWQKADGGWTNLDANIHSCGDSRRLYCFQQ